MYADLHRHADRVVVRMEVYSSAVNVDVDVDCGSEHVDGHRVRFCTT